MNVFKLGYGCLAFVSLMLLAIAVLANNTSFTILAALGVWINFYFYVKEDEKKWT